MTTQNTTKLDELEEKINDINGLKVKRRQSESSYPTDSLAVSREGFSGLIPVEIQELVKDKEAEVIDVEDTTRTVWVIPYRGRR